MTRFMILCAIGCGGAAPPPADPKPVAPPPAEAKHVEPPPAETTSPVPTNDQARDASKEFVDNVSASRHMLQTCYEHALKAGTASTDKPVDLEILASFDATKLTKLDTSPSLGATFDACVQSVAARWVITTTNGKMTFKAVVTLTPS